MRTGFKRQPDNSRAVFFLLFLFSFFLQLQVVGRTLELVRRLLGGILRRMRGFSGSSLDCLACRQLCAAHTLRMLNVTRPTIRPSARLAKSTSRSQPADN